MLLTEKEVHGRMLPHPETLSESPVVDLKKGQSLTLQSWLFKINGSLRPTGFQIAIEDVSKSTMTAPSCTDCKWKMHYDSKIDDLKILIGKFPPYHGPGWNYTKQEVEDWLAEARKILK